MFRDLLNNQPINIVSLGSFCGPAMELERFGMKGKSLPFVWLLSYDFSAVMRLINSGFLGFLGYENLFQSKKYPNHYFDKINGIWFYHDFQSIDSLDNEIISVCKKYQRRIDRFYRIIHNPTIFMRYVMTQKDADWIKTNQRQINDTLKSFNGNNVIFYIFNSDLSFDVQNSYRVEKDKGDSVSRHFFDKLPNLRKNLEYNFSSKLLFCNRIRYNITKIKRFLKKIINKLFYQKKNYIHSNVIDDL